MEITRNQAALASVALLAATSVGSFFAAMATASKVGSIVYGLLGIVYGGATLAGTAAWFDQSTYDYFDAFRTKLELGTDRIHQLATQSLWFR